MVYSPNAFGLWEESSANLTQSHNPNPISLVESSPNNNVTNDSFTFGTLLDNDDSDPISLVESSPNNFTMLDNNDSDPISLVESSLNNNVTNDSSTMLDNNDKEYFGNVFETENSYCSNATSLSNTGVPMPIRPYANDVEQGKQCVMREPQQFIELQTNATKMKEAKESNFNVENVSDMNGKVHQPNFNYEKSSSMDTSESEQSVPKQAKKKNISGPSGVTKPKKQRNALNPTKSDRTGSKYNKRIRPSPFMPNNIDQPLFDELRARGVGVYQQEVLNCNQSLQSPSKLVLATNEIFLTQRPISNWTSIPSGYADQIEIIGGYCTVNNQLVQVVQVVRGVTQTYAGYTRFGFQYVGDEFGVQSGARYYFEVIHRGTQNLICKGYLTMYQGSRTQKK